MLWTDLEVGDTLRFTDEFVSWYKIHTYLKNHITDNFYKELVIKRSYYFYPKDEVELDFEKLYFTINNLTGSVYDLPFPVFKIVKLKDE